MGSDRPRHAPRAEEPLHERERELAEIGRLLDSSRRGRGGTLLVEAPPGLGKSALLQRAADRGAAAGLAVARATGHELESGYAWGVARSLLEPAIAAVPADARRELLTGPAAPARSWLESAAPDTPAFPSDVALTISHALYWLTARLAERAPLLLAVDDAHWADEASLRFLVYLAGRVADLPVALLVAARSEELDHAGILDHLRARVDARVQPAPLGEAAVGAMIDARLGATDPQLRRRCRELTAGNPLYLRELLLGLATQAERPPILAEGVAQAARSLASSVRRRLGSLSTSARDLAEAVAVMDQDVRLVEASALSELPVGEALDACAELVRADLLRPGEPVTFAHPLLRTAVYDGISPRRRAASHQRAAWLLADGGAPAERVAAHLMQVPPEGDERAVQVLVEAARSASSQGVPGSAARYLRRAVLEQPAGHLRAAVLADLGRAEAAAGDAQAALESLQAAVDLTSDPAERVRLGVAFARALHQLGRLREACEVVEQERRALGGEDSDLTMELEAAYLTSALHDDGLAAEAHRRAGLVLQSPPVTSGPAQAVLMSKALLVQVLAGEPAADLLPAARRLLADPALVAAEADPQALWHVAGALAYCDDYGAGDDAISMLLHRARRSGFAVDYAAGCLFRSRLRVWTGPVAGAAEDGRLALDLMRDGGFTYLPGAGHALIAALIEQGELAEAAEVLAELAERGSQPGYFGLWQDMAAGRLAAAQGDHGSAREIFLRAGSRYTEMAVLNPAVQPWRSEAALAAVKLGQAEQARTLVAEELALARKYGAPRAVAMAYRAAAAIERGDEAVTLLRRAAGLLERCNALVDHSRVLAELGGAVRRAGRPAEARPILRDAMTVALRCGATAVAEAARAELHVAGGRAAAPSAEVDPLTPGERRVVELAAEGRTNRQIANHLFITVKAVEWHLSNAYRKLGVQGRSDLASVVGDQPMLERDAGAPRQRLR